MSKLLSITLICLFLAILLFLLGPFLSSRLSVVGLMLFFIFLTILLPWSALHDPQLIRINEKIKNIFIRLGIIPRYSEMSLFLTSLTFLLLFFTNSIIGKTMFFIVKEAEGKSGSGAIIFYLLAIIFFFLGAIFSIYHAFSKRKKEDIEKYCMLIFAVITNSVVGIIAAGYILIKAKGYLIIFPLLNIFEGLLTLLIFSKTEAIGIESILDEDAKMNEIKIGIPATIIIFIISQYVFKNYWAITFSICLAYVSFLNNILSGVFFPNKIPTKTT